MTSEEQHKEIIRMLSSLHNSLESIVLRLDGIDGQLTITNKRLSKIEERLSNIEKWIPTENSNLV